ncbi:MAG: phytoene/squalene synthase family protein [Kofleriaceae bacterium]
MIAAVPPSTALVPTGAIAAATSRATMAYHGKSFALASRLLPPASRDAAAVVYTYCRRVDDAIDEAPAADGPAAIARLTAELDDVYAGTATEPVLAAFAAIARARALPRHYPAELIAGMAMDVADTRYHHVDELIGYGYRVAGVVGLMMCHVFGVDDDAALVPAAHLGIAMQLTNIARDVREDWARGRLYLPDELLARHGAGGLVARAGEPLPTDAAPALAATTRDLLALAERYYASGDRGLRALPWRAALAVRAARRVYAAIGGRLARRGHDVTAGRVVVSTPRKLGLVASATGAAVGDGLARLVRPRRGRHRPPAVILELRDVPRL